ncbi:MAG: AI-2E family transporter [Gemmatimonadota bacterium]|jgi:predicted PurR-regulated permease PerM|nr:AI-2E family transporter [Gemmatimonadota bacterium]
MTRQSYISPGLRFLLSFACLVIIIAGLRAASPILVPFALALFVAIVSLPLLRGFRRWGMPTAPAILVIVLFDGLALFVLGSLIRLTSLEAIAAYPFYLQRLLELERETITWFGSHGLELVPPSELWFPSQTIDAAGQVVTTNPDLNWILTAVRSLARWATDILTTVFLVVLIFIFILAESTRFERKMMRVAGGERLGRAVKIITEIQHYLAIKTLISIASGVTIGVALWAMNVDFALLWGVLAFALNYIPNVGSIAAAVPAILIALLQFGPGVAAITVVIHIAVNALFGNLLEPMLMGRQFGISPLMVMIGLVFWGWVWGPIGMFLSVPLTVALKIGLENSNDFGWVAVLMASGANEPGEPAPEGVPAVVNQMDPG